MTTMGTDAGSTHEDQLFARRYRQVTDAQAAQYATTYDMGAGLKRFKDWLAEHTAADQDHFSGDTAATATRADLDPRPAAVWPVPATARLDAGQAAMQLYAVHRRGLVRLAALLVRDTPTAEDVVQDSFIAMRDAWDRLGDTDRALAYLRQAVVNRSRSVLRHRAAIAQTQQAPPDTPDAEDEVLIQLERSAVVAALRKLPARQREAIVLRYYADLPEAEIAAAMGISRGAVKSHTARGMSALRAAMQQEPS
jgi:RNA polymerase sigma-70 factor (sigma-E family)